MWIDDWKKNGIDVVISPPVPVPAEVIDEKAACSSGIYSTNGGFSLPNSLLQ